MNGPELIQWKMESPIGALYLVASPTGLRGILWRKAKCATVEEVSNATAAGAILVRCRDQLAEYFAGKRREFDLPIDLRGTPFQMRVWEQLRRIPYGKTLSYRELATKVRNPKAFRAVGTANGRNPISIVIPCHRVIAADGTLGGYAGGLPTKTRLLRLENGEV